MSSGLLRKGVFFVVARGIRAAGLGWAGLREWFGVCVVCEILLRSVWVCEVERMK